MTIKDAISICEEMQKWRRERPPYDGDTPETHRPMPYSAKEYGEALDGLITFAKATVQMQEVMAAVGAKSQFCGFVE